MACFHILSLVALAIASTQAIYSPYAFQYGAFPGYPGVPVHKGFKKEPLTLTCFKSFLGGKDHPVVVEAIAVTIKERKNSFGNIHPSLLAYAAGNAGLHGSGGLTASIDVFSKYGGDVSIGFTEKARPERGCKADDFGDFFTSKKGQGAFPGAFVGSSFGGYGGVGGAFGGYGAFGPAGFGPIGHLAGFGDDHDKLAPGVIASVRLAPGTGSTINIDNLKDFTSLKELAGRGLIVCPTKNIDKDYHGAKCEGEILSCCSLHYDMGQQVIDFGKPYEYEK